MSLPVDCWMLIFYLLFCLMCLVVLNHLYQASVGFCRLCVYEDVYVVIMKFVCCVRNIHTRNY